MLIKADLHMHSVLSACADKDNTVSNLANMCAILGIQLAALSDHNSARNARAFSKACINSGVLAVPAIEVTSSEEIHVLCLFRKIDDAEKFSEEVYSRLPKYEYDRKFYNDQLVLDENDNTVGSEKYLLSVACGYSLAEITESVRKIDGIAIPAHIDRQSYSVISVLGEIPETLNYSAIELSSDADESVLKKYQEKYNVIVSSDAHNLEALCNSDFSIDLPRCSVNALIDALLNKKTGA